jgi:cytochrome c556
MGHRKSILAAALLAAFGLGTAAHIVRSGSSEPVPQYGQAPILNARSTVSAMAWVNPPARASALSALSNAVVTTAQAAEVTRPENADAEEHQATQAIQRRATERKATAARLKAQRERVLAERLRRAKALLQHKLAQHRMRLFQASLTRRMPRAPKVGEQAPLPAPAPRAVDQSDPIRILIHGLGLDG